MSTLILRKTSGFTLLEVVFAVAILAFAMLAYTTLKSSSRYSRIYSSELSQSIMLSNGELERFWLEGYNSPLMALGSHVSGDTFTLGKFQLDDVRWTVRDACPSPLTKMIEFTSTWNAVAIKPKTLTIKKVMVRP
ncbi:MAG: type II secretion system GspH family protein [Proteobacteria bacterium]|nr:type II secretion system GspH family protein [Pseudomonadota bacterium]MBU1686771.1 type II secretion system GspH family protein [Pseudomonadota bacterium]